MLGFADMVTFCIIHIIYICMSLSVVALLVGIDPEMVTKMYAPLKPTLG